MLNSSQFEYRRTVQQPSRSLKATVLIFVVGALLLVLAESVLGQERAATKIAEAAQPTTLLIDATVKCAALGDKDSRKFCLKLLELEVKRGTKVANEAADATQKNRWSPVIAPYGYYGGGGWATSGVVVLVDPNASTINRYGGGSYR